MLTLTLKDLLLLRCPSSGFESEELRAKRGAVWLHRCGRIALHRTPQNATALCHRLEPFNCQRTAAHRGARAAPPHVTTFDTILVLRSVTVCQGSKCSPCAKPYDQRGDARSPLMRACFIGTAAKVKAFLLLTWKGMGDETAVLQAYPRWSPSPYSPSKALCYLSRCPASSLLSIPSGSQAPSCSACYSV